MLKSKRANGFTFIELLVVMTIMAVLTVVAVVSYRSANINGRNGKRKADLEVVRQALVNYRSDNATYPDVIGWSAMITAVSDYLSATTVTDPLNDPPYEYSYSTLDDGLTFTVCAYLEPDPGEEYCLANP